MKDNKNYTEEQKEDQAILEEIRAKSKQEGTVESFIFGMLSSAHPNAIELIEQQAVMMVKSGKAIAESLNKAENDPDAKAKVIAAMEKAASSLKKFENDNSEDFREEDLDI